MCPVPVGMDLEAAAVLACAVLRRTRADMPALIRLIEAGAITVDARISTRVPLDEAGRVHDALDRGEIVGRALVVP